MNELIVPREYWTQQSGEAPKQEAGVASPLLLFSVIWRYKVSIVVIGMLLSCALIAIIAIMPTSYVASASVLVQERKSPVLDIQTSGTVATDSVAVRTQADILKSADLARRVVSQLHLTEEPEFSPPGGSGLGALIVDWIKPFDTAGWLARLGLFTPPPPPTPEQRLELATNILLGMTSILNDGRSYVIEIKVKIPAKTGAQADRAGRLSALIANTYAEMYTQFTGKLKSDVTHQVYGFFDERIEALKAKVDKAEHAVQTYRLEHNLIDNSAAGGDGRLITVANQQLAQLNTSLIAATNDRAIKEASLGQITAAQSGHSDLQSVAEIVGSPLMQRLREQQVELAGRDASLSASRGSSAPDLVAVRAAERDVASQIAAEASKIAASLRGAVEASRARETALRSKLAQLQSQVGSEGVTEIQLRELQNQADIAKSVYSTYLQKATEASEQMDMQEPDALIVSRAGIPLAAAPPSKAQLSGLGVVVSLAIATLLALVRERLNTGFRTASQVKSAVGVETLGYVPRAANSIKALAFEKPYAQFSEAILSIRSLMRMSVSRDGCVLMVTSALAGEGKTFLAAAIARNAALAGERVLLIDCSIREPAVAQAISATGLGLINGLAIRRDTASSLEIVTLRSDSCSPTDLFASDHMRRLISTLRSRYQLVILDCPPVLSVSDSRVLSELCDAVMLVVAWRRTPQVLVTQAANILRGSGAALCGVIMNRVNTRQLSRIERASAGISRTSFRTCFSFLRES